MIIGATVLRVVILLIFNTETRADFENDEMFEEEESDKLESVNLELGQGEIVFQISKS